MKLSGVSFFFLEHAQKTLSYKISFSSSNLKLSNVVETETSYQMLEIYHFAIEGGFNLLQ